MYQNLLDGSSTAITNNAAMNNMSFQTCGHVSEEQLFRKWNHGVEGHAHYKTW